MISVCLATYNGEKYIKDQLDSILAQLSSDDEVVISDDGSIDATLNIIASYHDVRIKIFHHQKRKITYPSFHKTSYFATSNFENAIKNAKGDYIFLSDQDDIWPNDKIKIFLTYLREYDFVMSNYSLIDENGNVINENVCPKAPFYNSILKTVYISRIGGCMSGFRRSVLRYALPFPKKLLAHDIWIFSLAQHYGKVSYIEKPLLLHRTHSENVSGREILSVKTIFGMISWRVVFIVQYFIRILLKEKTK